MNTDRLYFSINNLLSIKKIIIEAQRHLIIIIEINKHFNNNFINNIDYNLYLMCIYYNKIINTWIFYKNISIYSFRNNTMEANA